MKKVLALDLSTKTGWALLSGPQPVSVEGYGKIEVAPFSTEGVYPWNYVAGAAAVAGQVRSLIEEHGSDIYVVIEETNLGRSRYAQKALEFIHHAALEEIKKLVPPEKVVYISSSAWRLTLQLRLTAADRAANKKLKEASAVAKKTGKKLDKKALGVTGRVTQKHLSVRWVNEHFGLELKMKDNDIADAICLGTAFLRGAKTCDGR